MRENLKVSPVENLAGACVRESFRILCPYFRRKPFADLMQIGLTKAGLIISDLEMLDKETGRYGGWAVLRDGDTPWINLYAYQDYQRYETRIKDSAQRKKLPAWNPATVAVINGDAGTKIRQLLKELAAAINDDLLSRPAFLEMVRTESRNTTRREVRSLFTEAAKAAAGGAV